MPKHMRIFLSLRHGHFSPKLPPIDVRSVGPSKVLVDYGLQHTQIRFFVYRTQS